MGYWGGGGEPQLPLLVRRGLLLGEQGNLSRSPQESWADPLEVPLPGVTWKPGAQSQGIEGCPAHAGRRQD